MTEDVRKLIEHISSSLNDAGRRIDKPMHINGHWFIDFDYQGHDVVVEWRPGRGFGVSSAVEYAYGQGPDEVYFDVDQAADRVIHLLRTKTRTND